MNYLYKVVFPAPVHGPEHGLQPLAVAGGIKQFGVYGVRAFGAIVKVALVSCQEPLP